MQITVWGSPPSFLNTPIGLVLAVCSHLIIVFLFHQAVPYSRDFKRKCDYFRSKLKRPVSTYSKSCLFYYSCERFEPGSHFKSRLSLIVRVNVVLNRTVVVDSDWRFDNLSGSYLQCGQAHGTKLWQDDYRTDCRNVSHTSTTTVLFKTMFTRAIKLNLLLLFLLLCKIFLKAKQSSVWFCVTAPDTRTLACTGRENKLARFFFKITLKIAFFVMTVVVFSVLQRDVPFSDSS